jgi:hypothetical protein
MRAVDTSLGDNAKHVRVLGSYIEGGMHDLMLVTWTRSVLLAVNHSRRVRAPGGLRGSGRLAWPR